VIAAAHPVTTLSTFVSYLIFVSFSPLV